MAGLTKELRMLKPYLEQLNRAHIGRWVMKPTLKEESDLKLAYDHFFGLDRRNKSKWKTGCSDCLVHLYDLLYLQWKKIENANKKNRDDESI